MPTATHIIVSWVNGEADMHSYRDIPFEDADSLLLKWAETKGTSVQLFARECASAGLEKGSFFIACEAFRNGL